MATTAQILAAEANNPTDIHLFREGLFWKAYQRSAFRFLAVTTTNYKVTKKYIKVVDCEVLSLGFPSMRLDGLFASEIVSKVEQNHIVIRCEPFDESHYDLWAEKIEAQKPRPTSVNNVITRIKNYRMENSSPLECMNFMSTIQQELRTIDGSL